MRRLILFMLCLCVHWIARGQTGYGYRYWFDDDVNSAFTGTSAGSTWNMNVPLDGLDESLHVFHFQVSDAAGAWSAPVSRYFVKLTQPIGQQGTYWFDDDYSTHRTTPVTNGIMEVDVSSLADGFHEFHYMASGVETLSAVRTSFFIKQTDPSLFHYLIWAADNPENILKGKYTGEPVSVDVSSLTDGFYTLYVQVVGGASATHPSSAMFIKIPQTDGVDFMNCLFMVDDKFYRSEQVPASGGVIEWTLDVDHLEQGLHRYLVQVVTPSGAGSTIKEGFFLRETMKSELQSLQCCFMVDGDSATVQAGTISNGVYHFDLDVSKLTDGLHRIAYWLVGDNAVSSAVNSSFFVKTPLGGNGITQYQYWLNDLEDEKHVIQLEPRVNPLSIITLLPVETQPLRSANFRFALKNGQPLLYARNELHLRFFDAADRFTQITKEYVDEQVTGSVEPVGELQATQTFAKVAENDIRWYTVPAEPGDTLAFRLSQAATLQLFAPSGEEVFSSLADASVKWNGIHSWENGTYYLAVHDVTGSKSTMTLDYIHMDKYDVVDWDVHTVGNGGCSTITFKGNGFRDLYAVDLYTEEGDTIHAVDVSHDSDAETAVTFDFSGAKMGVYDAVFRFTEEDKLVSEVMTVEEAVDIELATNVSFPSTFLRGTSTTYTIKITNKGNMTAYQVPLELKLRTKSLNSISYVEFGGQISSLIDVTDIVPNDSIDQDVIDGIRSVWNSSGDLSQFAFIHDSIDNLDYGISFVFINLPPNTTKQLTVSIKSSSEVYLSAFMASDWNPVSDIDLLSIKSRKKIVRKVNVGEWLCCYRERVECVADVVGSIVSALPGVPPNINCGYQLGNTLVQAMYDIGCSEGTPSERLRKYAEQKGESLIGRLRKSAVDCVIGYFFGRINSLRDDLKLASQLGNGTEANRLLNEIQTLQAMQRSAINKLYNSGSIVVSAVDCVNKFRTPIPNCPRYPTGGGGTSTPVPPVDPNDIFGYLSDAGSKFIADSVAKVNYTIEFENDTTFATASAHTIVIRDTLDNSYFNMHAFMPTKVRIGNHDLFLTDNDISTSDNVTSFVKTIDMRPEIYAIAQVEGTYSQQTGIAEWRFTSLDPMTMEPTDDIMQGILPVNYDGTSGIGEVMFEIGVKANKGDGAQIANRAGIVFDYEEAILTPTWVNTVDAVAPVSTIRGGIQTNDSTLTLRLAGEDARSGVWKYNVYAQFGAGTSWELVAENVTDTLCDVRIYEDIDYSFCVLATDSAGNVEKKVFSPEFSLSSDLLGDANGDGNIDLTDAVMITYHSLGTAQPNLNWNAADVNRDGVVDLTDAIIVVYRSLGTESGGAGQGSGAEPE